MKVIVKIEGREAIPVRAIPLLTDWEVLNPLLCAEAFAGMETTAQSFEGLSTHRVVGDGHEAIDARQWNWAVRELKACSERIEADQVSHEVGYQQWRQESLALLPAGVFVWCDEFKAAYQSEYGPGGTRERNSQQPYDAKRYGLNFNPEPWGLRGDWREVVMEGFGQLAVLPAQTLVVPDASEEMELPQAVPAPQEDCEAMPVGAGGNARNAPVRNAKVQRRTTLLDVTRSYIVEVMQVGQYATAKDLYRALEKKAGSGDSPFDKGEACHHGCLFVREISKPLALKTLQNYWKELRELALK